MFERKLPTRKRKFTKGKAVRVSDLVYSTLDKKRYGKSWDAMFRRMLGLPDRRGVILPLVEGMLEVMTGIFVLKLEGTSWSEVEETAFKLADAVAKKKDLPTYRPPLKMRELR